MSSRHAVFAAAFFMAIAACKKKDVSVADAGAAKPGVAAPLAPTKPSAPDGTRSPGLKVTTRDARGVVTSMMDALSAGQLDDALSYYDDQHEQSFVVAPLRIMKGKDVLKGLWSRMRSSFPDARVKPRRILDGGDRWIVQAVLLGSHKGQFGATAPTGKPVGTEILYFLDAKNGKITKSMSLSNAGALFKQVGQVKGEHAVPEWPRATEVVKGAAEPGMPEKAKAFYDALSKGDFAALDAQVAPLAKVGDNLFGGKTLTWDGYKQRLQTLRLSFPDLQFKFDDTSGVGSFAVVNGSASGTQKGALGEVAASNRPVTYRFVDVLRFEGGKIAGIDTYADLMQIMQQIAMGPGAPSPFPARRAPGH